MYNFYFFILFFRFFLGYRLVYIWPAEHVVNNANPIVLVYLYCKLDIKGLCLVECRLCLLKPLIYIPSMSVEEVGVGDILVLDVCKV